MSSRLRTAQSAVRPHWGTAVSIRPARSRFWACVSASQSLPSISAAVFGRAVGVFIGGIGRGVCVAVTGWRVGVGGTVVGVGGSGVGVGCAALIAAAVATTLHDGA